MSVPIPTARHVRRLRVERVQYVRLHGADAAADHLLASRAPSSVGRFHRQLQQPQHNVNTHNPQLILPTATKHCHFRTSTVAAHCSRCGLMVGHDHCQHCRRSSSPPAACNMIVLRFSCILQTTHSTRFSYAANGTLRSRSCSFSRRPAARSLPTARPRVAP